MRFLTRLFGSAEDEKAFALARDEARRAAGMTLAPDKRLRVTSLTERFVHIPELDFFGQWSRSPNDRFLVTWRDGNDEQTHSGHRSSGQGVVLLLEEDRLLAQVRVDRPNSGRVADDGTFIINDWGFGEGLSGTFRAFRPDGSIIIADPLTANLFNNGIGNEGRLAVCQTANAPGDDGSKLVIYDLKAGSRLALVSPEQGWASSYAFGEDGDVVECLYDDGSSARYDLEGRMLDREAWLSGRISSGDVRIIANTIKQRGAGLPGAEAVAMIAGLKVAIAREDLWGRARAFRFKGEILEQTGKDVEALQAYDEALRLDPQVGALRRAEKLRARLSPPPRGASPVQKLSKFERQAEQLGIEFERIELDRGGAKEWRYADHLPHDLVERATLCHYQAQGWSGTASEGGLILTLLKAASFEQLDHRNADTFIEALYAQNVAFEVDRFGAEELISAVRRATMGQLERNWAIISATAGDTPAYYPQVRWSHVAGLFEALGPARLASIAEKFAKAPYDLRAGWPDLTLWSGSAVRFVEVKAPGDQLHASQSRLISTILVPLGFQTGIAQIVARGGSTPW
jgi:tetratricopeptide (TPR) repeat protein